MFKFIVVAWVVVPVVVGYFTSVAIGGATLMLMVGLSTLTIGSPPTDTE